MQPGTGGGGCSSETAVVVVVVVVAPPAWPPAEVVVPPAPGAVAGADHRDPRAVAAGLPRGHLPPPRSVGRGCRRRPRAVVRAAREQQGHHGKSGSATHKHDVSGATGRAPDAGAPRARVSSRT